VRKGLLRVPILFLKPNWERSTKSSDLLYIRVWMTRIGTHL